MTTVEELLREVGKPVERRRIADLVLNWCWDAIEGDRGADVETALRSVDVETSELSTLVYWLVGSLCIADRSEIRACFFVRVKKRFERDAPERAEQVLVGLGSDGAQSARDGMATLAVLFEGGPR